MATENEQNNFEAEKIINHWVESSDIDYETMLSLFESNHYNWTLFIGHLLIEKLLKAYYVKINNEHPPLIHNLLRLIQKSKIKLNTEQEDFFAEVTKFNINVRYDDYKLTFYKKCTKEYTELWFNKIKDYRLWIKTELLNL